MAQQILVIGAGISGLATAVAFQRRGHEVAVIEERTDACQPQASASGPTRLRHSTKSASGTPYAERAAG